MSEYNEEGFRLTDEHVAQYLIHNPDFFQSHAELLASVQLVSAHGDRAVSLQERQAELLRDKIRHLETQRTEMFRNAQNNEQIIDRIYAWVRDLLVCSDPALLPVAIVSGIEEQFHLSEAAVKVWGVAPEYASDGYATGISDAVRSFAGSLTAPYVGRNNDFEAVGWLTRPERAASIAMVPLRVKLKAGVSLTIGLLVISSEDPKRFTPDMGTEILERLGELAASALMRLRA